MPSARDTATAPAAAARVSSAGHRFWRSVSAVLAGTALAQAIPLIGSLWIARLYVPTEFGVFATWLGVAHLAAVAVTGRFEAALALEFDGGPRRVAVLATLATVAAAGVVLALGVASLALWGDWPAVPGALWWLLVPTALAIATAQTWQSWAAAEGRVPELSRMRVAQAAAITGAQILVGCWLPSAAALAAAQALGLALGLCAAWHWMPLNQPALPTAAELRVGMRAFWTSRRRFPLLSLPADGINAAAAQLPLLIVGSRFGAEVAGYLALTLRVLAAPVGLLGSAVLDVFRRRSAASWRERGHCRDDFLQTFKGLSLGSLAVATVLAFGAEPLFVLAFGERWRAAGTMALWLLPLFALRFVASPLSYLFYVAGKQHVDLLWQCGLLAMTLATLLLPAGYREALIAYSMGYCAMYGVYLGLCYRYSLGVRV
jgi:O-antigen/teichoic acid export membrane protein